MKESTVSHLGGEDFHFCLISFILFKVVR